MPYSPLFAGRVIKAADAKVKVIGTFHIVPATVAQKKRSCNTLQLLPGQLLTDLDHIVDNIKVRLHSYHY